MLRGKPNNVVLDATGPLAMAAIPDSIGFPTGDQPYAVDERPAGVLFYQAKESFFLPYLLLHAMQLTADKLTLTFAPADVVIEGHGLHSLYVQMAAQRVSRVVEQGERYADIADAPVHISRIEHVPK